MEFEKRYEQTEHVILMAIYKCRIYKNIEHYKQVGREAVWHAHQRFKGNEEDFTAYAYTFVKNALLNELRKMSRKEEREVLIEKNETIESFYKNQVIPDLSYEIEKLISPLKEQDKKLLYMLYVEQYSYEETAKFLHISVHALKKRRDRLIKLLRSRKKELFN